MPVDHERLPLRREKIFDCKYHARRLQRVIRYGKLGFGQRFASTTIVKKNKAGGLKVNEQYDRPPDLFLIPAKLKVERSL